jgi:hypothetical protein
MGKDTRELILENVKKLTERITSLTEELTLKGLELKSEKEKNVRFKNLCWWDAKVCPRYTEISGLQEAGLRCSDCYRVNKDSLNHLLEGINLIASEEELEAEKEEARKEDKEQFEETLQEIHEGIVSIMAVANVELSD